jgi:hypothetical protein
MTQTDRSPPVRLVSQLGDIPKDTPLAQLGEVFFKEQKRALMHGFRYRGHLEMAKEMLERRVRLAYAVLGTSVPLFVGYGARIALGSTGFDITRAIIPLVGIALCYVALRIERGHYQKNGESLIAATAREEEDGSSEIDGPGRLAAEQHARGFGFSSVGAAAAATWLVWVSIAAYEIARL